MAPALSLSLLLAPAGRSLAQRPAGAPGVDRFQDAQADLNSRPLLRRIRQAERLLSLSGEQVTILYSAPGRAPEASEQTIFYDSALGYRCEYHSPARLAGQIIVSRADGWWHYMPKRRVLAVGAPRPRRVGVQIGPALRALRQGMAQASVIGRDTVAGRSAQIIVIAAGSNSPTPTAKLWIDEATGAQLRTELYDTQGQLRSVSYFTQVSFNPAFAPGTFDPPAVPAGTRTVTQQSPLKLNRLPTDAEAGFHVLAPASVPAGYVFESASVFRYPGGRGQGVTLSYQNNLTVLSLFERALADRPGAGFRAPETASPRAGTVVVRRNGVELIAIGSLSDADLLTVLNSMR